MYKCLAAQAVKLKAGFEPFTSLISDYEFAYALGLAYRFTQNTDKAETLISQDFPELNIIRENFNSFSDTYSPKDKFEKNILSMICDYVVIGTKASEIAELFIAGLNGIEPKD